MQIHSIAINTTKTTNTTSSSTMLLGAFLLDFCLGFASQDKIFLGKKIAAHQHKMIRKKTVQAAIVDIISALTYPH